MKPTDSTQSLLVRLDKAIDSRQLKLASRLLSNLSPSQLRSPSIKTRLAYFYFVSENFEKASELFMQLITEMPNDFLSYLNGTKSLIREGKDEKALKVLNLAVKRFPNNPEVHLQTGKLLIFKKKYNDSYNFLSGSLKRFPNNPNILFIRGETQLLGLLNDYGLADFQKYLSIVQNTNKGDELSVHMALVRASFRSGNDRQLISSLQAAYQLVGTEKEHLRFLIEYSERTDNLPMMGKVLQKALSLYPNDYDIRALNAIYLVRNGEASSFLSYMLSSRIEEKADKELVIKIKFELGKMFDKQGEYARAFDCFEVMNQLLVDKYGGADANKKFIQPGIQYINELEKLIPAIAKQYNSNSEIHLNNSPVFFVGFPRSGTTMVDQILSSHPDIEVISEKTMVGSVANKIQADFGKYPSMTIFNTGKKELDGYRALYSHYLDNFRNTDRPIVIDKMPMNILHIPLILLLYPNAKILVALRHPFDTILSCFFQLFEYNAAMANFVTLEQTATYYQRVMDYFLLVQRLYEHDIYTFRYEDLVDDLRAEGEKLISYLGLSWSESIMKFHETARKRAIINTPSYMQVTQPLYSRSVNRWTNYRNQFQQYAPRLESIMDSFGYTA